MPLVRRPGYLLQGPSAPAGAVRGAQHPRRGVCAGCVHLQQRSLVDQDDGQRGGALWLQPGYAVARAAAADHRHRPVRHQRRALPGRDAGRLAQQRPHRHTDALRRRDQQHRAALQALPPAANDAHRYGAVPQKGDGRACVPRLRRHQAQAAAPADLAQQYKYLAAWRAELRRAARLFVQRSARRAQAPRRAADRRRGQRPARPAARVSASTISASTAAPRRCRAANRSACGCRSRSARG